MPQLPNIDHEIRRIREMYAPELAERIVASIQRSSAMTDQELRAAIHAHATALTDDQFAAQFPGYHTVLRDLVRQCEREHLEHLAEEAAALAERHAANGMDAESSAVLDDRQVLLRRIDAIRSSEASES